MIPIVYQLAQNEALNLPLKAILSALAYGTCLGGNATPLDIDSGVLELAKEKFKSNTMKQSVNLFQGSATQLPFENCSFDYVVTSLFFHHLQNEQKSEVMTEIKRIVKLNGKIIIADWGSPNNFLMRICFFGVQLLDGFSTTSAHVTGIIESLLQEYFTNQRTLKTVNTIFGTLHILEATK